MQSATLCVFFQPSDKPRPLLEQRIVRELDRPAVGDEQSPLDENGEDASDVAVFLGVEFLSGRAPAGECLATLAGDQAEHDLPPHLLIVSRKQLKSSVRSAPTSAGSTSRAARSAGPSIARRSSPVVIGPSSAWFGPSRSASSTYGATRPKKSARRAIRIAARRLGSHAASTSASMNADRSASTTDAANTSSNWSTATSKRSPDGTRSSTSDRTQPRATLSTAAGH
jgi:hypothetical protein